MKSCAWLPDAEGFEMSRIAKKPITVPVGVEVEIDRNRIRVSGQKGQLELNVHATVEVSLSRESVLCTPRDHGKNSVAQTGTVRSLVANMVKGVTDGFEKELQLVGIGYRAQIQDMVLKLALGYSHSIEYDIPEDVTVVSPSPTRIIVSGADKQRVGQVAAEIRSYRPPEPYKGKGVRYAGEFVARKEAKKKQ